MFLSNPKHKPLQGMLSSLLTSPFQAPGQDCPSPLSICWAACPEDLQSHVPQTEAMLIALSLLGPLAGASASKWPLSSSSQSPLSLSLMLLYNSIPTLPNPSPVAMARGQETLFYCEGDGALTQVTQRAGGVSVCGYLQKPPGHGPGQLALGGFA